MLQEQEEGPHHRHFDIGNVRFEVVPININSSFTADSSQVHTRLNLTVPSLGFGEIFPVGQLTMQPISLALGCPEGELLTFTFQLSKDSSSSTSIFLDMSLSFEMHHVHGVRSVLRYTLEDLIGNLANVTVDGALGVAIPKWDGAILTAGGAQRDRNHECRVNQMLAMWAIPINGTQVICWAKSAFRNLEGAEAGDEKRRKLASGGIDLSFLRYVPEEMEWETLRGPMVSEVLCEDTCVKSTGQSRTSNGLCDDAGPRYDTKICAIGQDCEDCGPRTHVYENVSQRPTYNQLQLRLQFDPYYFKKYFTVGDKYMNVIGTLPQVHLAILPAATSAAAAPLVPALIGVRTMALQDSEPVDVRLFVQTELSPTELGEHVLSPLLNGDPTSFQLQLAVGDGPLAKMFAPFILHQTLPLKPAVHADRAKGVRDLFTLVGEWQMRWLNSDTFATEKGITLNLPFGAGMLLPSLNLGAKPPNRLGDSSTATAWNDVMVLGISSCDDSSGGSSRGTDTSGSSLDCAQFAKVGLYIGKQSKGFLTDELGISLLFIVDGSTAQKRAGLATLLAGQLQPAQSLTDSSTTTVALSVEHRGFGFVVPHFFVPPGLLAFNATPSSAPTDTALLYVAAESDDASCPGPTGLTLSDPFPTAIAKLTVDAAGSHLTAACTTLNGTLRVCVSEPHYNLVTGAEDDIFCMQAPYQYDAHETEESAAVAPGTAAPTTIPQQAETIGNNNRCEGYGDADRGSPVSIVSTHVSAGPNAAALLWAIATAIWLLVGCVAGCWCSATGSATGGPGSGAGSGDDASLVAPARPEAVDWSGSGTREITAF
jgi:hypothetical protein